MSNRCRSDPATVPTQTQSLIRPNVAQETIPPAKLLPYHLVKICPPFLFCCVLSLLHYYKLWFHLTHLDIIQGCFTATAAYRLITLVSTNEVITVTSCECDGVSNHRPLDCLFNSLFRSNPKITPKILIAGPLWVKPNPMDSPRKGPVMQKTVSCDDAIMFSQPHPITTKHNKLGTIWIIPVTYCRCILVHRSIIMLFTPSLFNLFEYLSIDQRLIEYYLNYPEEFTKPGRVHKRFFGPVSRPICHPFVSQ